MFLRVNYSWKEAGSWHSELSLLAFVPEQCKGTTCPKEGSYLWFAVVYKGLK